MHRSSLYTLPPLLACTLLLSAAPGHADELEGTVLAFDRVARVIVLKDRSVLPLELLTGEMPDKLGAGDRIAVSFESNEDDGYQVIHSVTLID